MEEILQDLADIKARDYIEKFETFDKASNDLAKKLVLEPVKTATDERQKLADEINAILGTKK
jgi:hypothetical protein